MKNKVNIATIDVASKELGHFVLTLNNDATWKPLELDEQDFSKYQEYRWFRIGKLSKRLQEEYDLDLQLYEKSNFGNFGSAIMKPIIDLSSVIRVLQSHFQETYPVNVKTWKSIIAKHFDIKWYTKVTGGDKDYKWKNKQLSVELANDILKDYGYNFNIKWKSKGSKYNEDNRAEAFLIFYALILDWYNPQFDIIRNNLKQEYGFVMDEKKWKEIYGKRNN